MDSVKEAFNAAAAVLARLLSAPGQGGAGSSMLEQVFPERGLRRALSRVPLPEDKPVSLPLPRLPNPLRAATPKPDKASTANQDTPAGQELKMSYNSWSFRINLTAYC